jgi:aspartyl-tRNA(Asn)/glutamyl-tRNA(Gln) amidotransferase subunit A
MADMAETAIEIAESVRRGERKANDVLDATLEAIAERNHELGAFVHVDEGVARAAADAVDGAVARGDDPGPLAGVPIGVKDLEDCAGMPTTYGSLAFLGRGSVAADSIHVARLRRAGAVPVGKTATPEFGTLSFTRTKAFGAARNPWSTDRTPGGSSGGSAAAVAAGIVPAATASDGGGSIRIPASFTGLVGFKASFGRIPFPGPHGSETSVLGILTTTVADSARHLDVTAGPHDRDRFSLPPGGMAYEQAAETLSVGGLKARWSPDLGFARCDPEVRRLAQAAAEHLAETAGLALDDEPVHLTDPVRTWLSAGAMDLWLDLEDGMWPAIRDDLTRYARSVLDQTEDQAIPRFAKVVQRRQQLVADAARLFEDVDLLLTPTTAVPAFAAEGPPTEVIDGETTTPRGAGATPFTMLANLCWNPAVSVPAGLTAEGLPVGLQIVARRHRDEIPLRLARIFEETRPWPRTASLPEVSPPGP